MHIELLESVAYVPAGQPSLHEEAASLECIPTAQAVQLAWLEVEYFPAGQDV